MPIEDEDSSSSSEAECERQQGCGYFWAGFVSLRCLFPGFCVDSGVQQYLAFTLHYFEWVPGITSRQAGLLAALLRAFFLLLLPLVYWLTLSKWLFLRQFPPGGETPVMSLIVSEWRFDEEERPRAGDHTLLHMASMWLCYPSSCVEIPFTTQCTHTHPQVYRSHTDNDTHIMKNALIHTYSHILPYTCTPKHTDKNYRKYIKHTLSTILNYKWTF